MQTLKSSLILHSLQKVLKIVWYDKNSFKCSFFFLLLFYSVMFSAKCRKQQRNTRPNQVSNFVWSNTMFLLLYIISIFLSYIKRYRLCEMTSELADVSPISVLAWISYMAIVCVCVRKLASSFLGLGVLPGLCWVQSSQDMLTAMYCLSCAEKWRSNKKTK